MAVGRFFVSAALMALIVIVSLGAIALTGEFSIKAALTIGIVIVVAQTLLLRSLHTGSTEVLTGVETLLTEPEAAPPALRTNLPAATELWLTILRLIRYYRERNDELRGELEELAGVLAAIPDPVLLVNARRAIVNANAAAIELLGEHLIGRDLSSAIRHPVVLAASDEVLRLGQSRSIEFQLTSPVERQLRVRIEKLPATNKLLVTLTDLTTLKRAEQLRADFVANASHELRTPLSSIIGFIETLEGPAAEDAEARKRFLPIMNQQASRMARLVDDLLSLSRIELHEHMAPREEVDVRTVLKTVSLALQIKAKARDMRIDLVPGTYPALVLGETEELAQVFQNLIDNALKYGDPGTAVIVSVDPSDRVTNGVAITVRDCGEGIAREHLPRLTERFYRIDSARSRAMGGTGLGLAIVKHIVSRHRAVLEIDSEVGQGSVFTVHLPSLVKRPKTLLAQEYQTRSELGGV